jgi:hypothetical protein
MHLFYVRKPICTVSKTGENDQTTGQAISELVSRSLFQHEHNQGTIAPDRRSINKQGRVTMQFLISNAIKHKQQMQTKKHIPIAEARESRGRLAATRRVKAWGVQESNLPSLAVHWLGTRLTLLTLLVSIQQLAEAQKPPLFTSAPTFFATNHYVAVSVFHWFTAAGGQLSGPWRPLEGRGAFLNQ